MMRPGCKVLFRVTCLVLAVAGGITATETLPSGPLELIERDFQQGRLTLDQMVRYQIQAIDDPTALPAAYRPLSLSVRASNPRQATIVLRDIQRLLPDLSPETQAFFRAAFLRPTTEFTYVSPGGYFRLHYDSAGTDSVPFEDLDLTEIPDFVEKCAAYCDTSWNQHLAIGYLSPPSDGSAGGDSLYDVYFMNMSFYGFVLQDGPGPEPWNDFKSYMTLHHTFTGFASNSDPEGQVWGAAKVTAAHEFHHAVQYAYDGGEPSWFIEMDAVHIEEIIFDHSNDNYNYLSSFFDAPEKSLMENSSHYYSTFIYPLYLSQKFDTSLMRAVWEGARYSPAFDALSDTLMGRYGWTQDSAFAEFVTWNYCTAGRWNDQYHEEGLFYPYVDIAATHSVYPVSTQTSPSSPAGYGSAYIEFYPGSDTGLMILQFNGDDTREWQAWVDISATMNEHQFSRIELDSYYRGSAEIANAEDYYRIALIGVNTDEFSGGAFFSYSADIYQPYSVSMSVLSEDTAMYICDTKHFLFEVNNTSALNSVFDMFVSDDSGWVETDTLEFAIAAGSSDTIPIPVNPPSYTVAGSSSEIHFLVRHRIDTLVADSVSKSVLAVIQHGDANCTGRINVADLTYMVAYLFGGGAPPLPALEGGDFNCQMPVNVADLTSLIGYLFLQGSPPPCNTL